MEVGGEADDRWGKKCFETGEGVNKVINRRIVGFWKAVEREI